MGFDLRYWQHSADCKPWCLNGPDWWAEEALTCYCKSPHRIRRDPLSSFGNGDGDTTIDGRPLFIGTFPYEEWCRPHEDSK